MNWEKFGITAQVNWKKLKSTNRATFKSPNFPMPQFSFSELGKSLKNSQENHSFLVFKKISDLRYTTTQNQSYYTPLLWTFLVCVNTPWAWQFRIFHKNLRLIEIHKNHILIVCECSQSQKMLPFPRTIHNFCNIAKFPKIGRHK